MTATLTAGNALIVVRAALESSGAFIRDRNPEAFMASCPLHADANPSLSVTWKTRGIKGTGVVLLHCFSCQGSAGEVSAALGPRLADLFDDADEPGRSSQRRSPARYAHVATPAPAPLPARITTTARRVEHLWQQTRVYTYTTAQGMPVQQVIRQECRCNGEPHKRFQQRYRDGRRWVYRKPRDFAPALYRAGALLTAADTGRPVWITEGEKDADTLTALGQLATTNAQGAASFPDELAAQFDGLTVIIAADRDLAGYQRAINLHDKLRHVAAHVTVVLPALSVDKSDVTDHVEARLWRAADRCGGLIATCIEDLFALHGAATARAAAERADIAIAEARAYHQRVGDRASAARWLTDAADHHRAVRGHWRKLKRHNEEHPSPITKVAETSTAELADRLYASYRRATENIRLATNLENIA